MLYIRTITSNYGNNIPEGFVKSVELFAGAGGLGIGTGLAGFENQAVYEWDKWCCETLRRNKKSWNIFEGDVRGVDFTEFREKIDLVTGGPPCQPFSMGGKHRGVNDDRDMFPVAVKAVRQIWPSAFIFENVKGLTRTSFSSYFEYIKLQLTYPNLIRKSSERWTDHLSRLEESHTKGKYRGLKYHVVARVLNSANYGVPQKRERVFIVGFRKDLAVEWHFPEETHSKDALLWEMASGEYWERLGVPKKERTKVKQLNLFKPGSKPWRTVRETIADLPDPERHPHKSKMWDSHRFQPGARSYPGHTGSPLDEPAKTLKAGVHGVPGGENMLRRSDGSVRYFSVRESARLQTFPDDFVFQGAWGETMRQLGNAVPVSLAEVVASDVLSNLKK